ncbi:MAG: hypothetical protein M3M96_03515 [Candidatus Eremiobacteraeota bacterium]|nr:hypothetical protein [Candidatus Eremiobacteraeota bacterium]
MIRAFFRLAVGAAFAAALLFPTASRAALLADPQQLYTLMKAAYDKGAAHGWSYLDQEVYLASIFNAGRAYALQRADDPGYGELNRLAVDIGSSLHYNPLINHEAVPWYVREAANWVIKNDGSPAEVAKANALLARVDALEDPARLAQLADQDAAANVQTYSRDPDARLQQIEADWRGWVVSKDPSWRSLALQRANDVYFPAANLPTTWGPAFVDALKNAVHGAEGFTEGDKTNAGAVLERIQRVNPLMIIGNVRSMSHDAYMTTLAPADEYFGPLGMSIIGINNELKRINLYLDSGWGDREGGAAVQVAVSIDDLHKVYPRDRDLPKLLLAVYKTLGRMHTSDTQGAAHHIRSILTVEYQDTAQAKELLAT